MRIRQIVFAARDLARTVDQFESELGIAVVYRDPEVAKFGLANAMLKIGDQFLEVVSPIRDDTAAGRHLDRHGDSPYMLILQTDDLAGDRARLAALGVRIVWESNHPDISAVHLHPKDLGAAIVSLDEARPATSWRWAGPDWESRIAGGDAPRIVGVTIRARNPETFARRWSQVLGLEPPVLADRAWRVRLADGFIDFVESSDDRDAIAEYVLEGLTGPERMLCGTTFRGRPT